MNDTLAVLLPLAAVWIFGVMTPGPNFFATMHMAARHGRRAALATVAGIAVGTTFWAAAGFLGIKTLFVAVPAAALAIKLAGAGYLVWMGIKMWRSAAATDQEMDLPAGRAFRFGLLTNLANAKTAAFAASLFAVALPADASWGLIAEAMVLIVGMAAAWYSFCGIVGSQGRVMAAYRRFQKWLMRTAGVVFVGFGLKLAAER